MNFTEQLMQDKSLVEDALKHAFRGQIARANLYDAMEYSLLAGGKRLRPILLLETCRMCGGDVSKALPLACGIEMIHTYSLIHDDLPCMDDDDLRRGRPTNHKVYGEAAAVLAGDGLLTAAFSYILTHRDGLSDGQILDALSCLADAAGASGMVGGQALDMAGEGCALTLADVNEIQRLKTGALIRAAAELGCIAAGGSDAQRKAVCQYAEKLGRAFQIRDDMLDVTGNTQTLGKTVGSDARTEKTTYVTLKGLDFCACQVEKLTAEAQEALQEFSPSQAEFLITFAQGLVDRKT